MLENNGNENNNEEIKMTFKIERSAKAFIIFALLFFIIMGDSITFFHMLMKWQHYSSFGT